MPGHAGAHDAVARGGRTSARVAGHHARHALHVLEHGVHSPKASAREHGDLLTLGRLDPGRGGEGRDLRLRDADTGGEGHEATEQRNAAIQSMPKWTHSPPVRACRMLPPQYWLPSQWRSIGDPA